MKIPDATSEPAPKRRRFFQSLKWVIILAVAVTEFGFDFIIEPWLRYSTGWEEIAERFLAVAEVLVMGAVVWYAFSHLDRLEQLLQRRHREVEQLYKVAKDREDELTALYEASLQTGRRGPYPEVLQTVVDVAASLVGAHFGALAEFDAEENVIEFVTSGVPEGVQEQIGLPPTHRGLLKRLREDRPVRLDDIRSDADFSGFPLHHPGLSAFLGTAIRSERELLGHLYLADAEPGVFTERDERVIQLFAQQAAVTIERARMDRERRALLRTEEQRRVAAELHDGVMQSLYAVAIQLARARRHGLVELTDTMTVEDASLALENVMSAIRGELEALDRTSERTPWLRLKREVNNVGSLYGLKMTWEGAAPDLSQEVSEVLIPSLNELVSNAARHGLATEVAVHTLSSPRKIVFQVRNNGQVALQEAPSQEGEGLRSTRRRLATLGAQLDFLSSESGAIAKIMVPRRSARSKAP